MSREPFLSRWSQRKLGRRPDQAEELPAAHPKAPPPELPSLDSVGLDTGIADFLRPGVEEGLRRLALKKLFSDPHFNVMDGLDVYIDDYSSPRPILPDILERLVEAQTRPADKNTGSSEEDQPPPQLAADSQDPTQTQG